MTGATSGAGTAYPSRAPQLTPVFIGVCVAQSCFLCSILAIVFPNMRGNSPSEVEDVIF